MQYYRDVLQDRNGNVISSATVTITDYPGGATSTAYATDAVGANVNPLTTTSDGEFEFYIVPGVYTITITKSGVTTEARVVTLGAASESFLQSGTGAVSRSVSNKLGDYISVKDFGTNTTPGTTDMLTPLTNFINAVLASSHRRGWMDAETYAISGALPDINLSGVEIYGGGPSSSHDVGSPPGTVIKKITNAGGTMLTIAPTEGASAQRLDGVKLIGVTFNGNSLAAKGCIIKSVTRSMFDISAIECTTTGIELNVSTTLGEVRSSNNNDLWITTRHYTNAAVGLRLIGDATANWSLNRFHSCDLFHKNELAQITENADNNTWGIVRAFQAAGGSATNSIEWRGGADSARSCRAEMYQKLSTTVAAIAKGTGTYTVGAQKIIIQVLDAANATPVPTEETGTTVFYQKDSTPFGDSPWLSFTPTVTAAVGTFTTVSAVGKYLQRGRILDFRMAITITTNGTAATAVLATLPVNAVITTIGHGKETAVTGVTMIGTITGGAASVSITNYLGTYPGGDGRTIIMVGSYEIA